MQVFLVHTPDDPVRLSFPDLHEAVPFEEGGPKRYSATFLLKKGGANDRKVQAAIKKAAEEAWQGKAAAHLKQYEGNSNKYCYIDGDLKEYDGYEGCMALSSHRRENDGKVTVIDRNRTALTAADGKPYGGCYVNGMVDIWIQTRDYPGVRCGLLGVQFVEDGDAFSGSRPANPEDFEDLGVQDGSAESLV